MAAEIRGHDVGARVGLAVLLDEIGKRLFDKGLKLAPFVVREGADSGKNAGIDLRCNPERWITSVWKRFPLSSFVGWNVAHPPWAATRGPICGASARVVAKRLDCSRWADDCSLTTPLMPARVPRKTIFTGGDACDCHR